MLTTVDMERTAAHGCGHAGCGHVEDMIYLHSRCHIEAPLLIISVANTMTLCCIQCGGQVASFSVKELKKSPDLAECCTEEIYWASYTKGTGIVLVTCYFCGKDVLQAVLN